jgi:ATP-binding protein involved in chromosome partitioning
LSVASGLDERVRDALSRVIDPEIRKPITELDMIGGVTSGPDGAVTVGLTLTIVGCPAADTIERDVREAAASVDGVTAVTVDVSIMTREQRTALTEKLRGGRSRRRTSRSPKYTSVRNCWIVRCSIGPRQDTAALSSTNMPIEITFTP